MTVLVVSHARDRVATAVATHLGDRGRPVVTTTPSALVSGAITYHDEGGRRGWTASVGAGIVTDDELTGVLNRATHLEPVGFDEADERYAHAERAALLAALFQVLSCPVLNRSNGATLAGPTPAPLQWLALAARIGLPVRGMTMSAHGVEWAPLSRLLGTVTVVDGHVVDDVQASQFVSDDFLPVALARSLGSGLVSLADALGCGLLQVRLGVDADDQLVVVDLDPVPAVLEPAALATLVDVLVGGAARTPVVPSPRVARPAAATRRSGAVRPPGAAEVVGAVETPAP